jgi:hypothetical protein
MSKRPSLAETMRLAATAPEPMAAPAASVPSALPQTSPATPGPERRFHAATRVGKKKVTATLTPADHKRLRHLALERDVTTEALLAEAIGDLFAKYGEAETG